MIQTDTARENFMLSLLFCFVSISDTSGPIMKVSHDYLASAYHAGIISGFTLVSSYLKKAESSGKMVSNYSLVATTLFELFIFCLVLDHATLCCFTG